MRCFRSGCLAWADLGVRELTDLGLSQLLTPGLTITGLGPISCVEYLDPAQIRGEPPSRVSDVWALGATLRQALTGNGLYGVLPTDNRMVAVRRVMSQPATILASLDTAARAVIRWATRQDNAARPVNAPDLAERIEALASDSMKERRQVPGHSAPDCSHPGPHRACGG